MRCQTQKSQSKMPANLSFVQAVGGWVFSCAMTNSGDGICWGANTESQQGIGNNSNEPFAVVPTLIQGPRGENMTSISSTTAQACAMYDQTGAYCWGDNWGGNTGDYNGSNDVICNYSGMINGGGNINCPDRAAPHQVHTGENYTAVVMGAANGCGLDSSNDIHCWGLTRLTTSTRPSIRSTGGLAYRNSCSSPVRRR